MSGLEFTPEDTLRVRGILDALDQGDTDRVLQIIGLYVGPAKVAQPLQLICSLISFIDTLGGVLAIEHGRTPQEILTATQRGIAAQAWDET